MTTKIEAYEKHSAECKALDMCAECQRLFGIAYPSMAKFLPNTHPIEYEGGDK